MITMNNPSMSSTAKSTYLSNSDFVIRERCRAREDAIIHEKYQAEQIEALTSENNYLTSKNSALISKNSALANENSALTSENSALSTEIERLHKLLKEHGIDAEWFFKDQQRGCNEEIKYEWAVSSQEYTYKKRIERAVAEAVDAAETKAKARGEIKGENRINALYSWLLKNNRIEDAQKATTDSDYRAKLLKEFDEASQDTAQSPDQNS